MPLVTNQPAGARYYFKYGGKEYCLDATHVDGIGRFINHSAFSYNVKPEAYLKEREPRIKFKATRDIYEGEEILHDYGDRDLQAIEVYPWLQN